MGKRTKLRCLTWVGVALSAGFGCSDSGAAKSDASTTNDRDATLSSGASQPSHSDTTESYRLVYDDPLFAELFVDIDEWREQPVRHRYVHGGFNDTEARFSIYFPPEEKYEGRFFQYILPVPGNENAVLSPEYPDPSYSVGFAVESGAYLIETNGGALGFAPTSDPEVSLWRVSAATAEHARILANKYYPDKAPHRPFGYAWGGSGGAFKTIACIESTSGVWDGVVPFVHASPIAMPNNFTVQAHAMRVLRGKLPMIIDALDPGADTDEYAGLNDNERAALAEVTKFGFPVDAWFNYQSIAFGYTGVLATLMPAVSALDGSYFADFWSKPGYLGADHPEQLEPFRIRAETSVAEVLLPDEVEARGLPLSFASAQPSNAKAAAGLKLSELPEGDLQGASITFTSGAAMGSVVQIAGVFDDIAVVSYGQLVPGLDSLEPGDELQVDNSSYLALQSYHRHTLPDREYQVYEQYRDTEGKPLFPQRDIKTSSLFNQTGMMSGKFKGKMIVVQNLTDEIAFPWHADWYRARVQEQLGDQLDEHYRLWYIEKAMHTPPRQMSNGLQPALTTRVTNFSPVLQQALRDVAAWVEQDKAPPASTAYEIQDGQVIVPPTAADRKGLQPVVAAKANGAARAEVAAGEAVTFNAVVELPADTGSIIAVEWDFEGTGEFPLRSELSDFDSQRVEVETRYAFERKGTYFPAVRASSHRDGKADAQYARIQNLARVRVIVK